MRDLNRLEPTGESGRAAVEALTVAAPHWVAGVLDVSACSRRYETRIGTWRMPSSATKRDQLALAYARKRAQGTITRPTGNDLQAVASPHVSPTREHPEAVAHCCLGSPANEAKPSPQGGSTCA